MDEGFILSNKYRRAIFDEFAAGEVNIRRIAKKHRIIQTGGILEKQGNVYVFTKKGEKLVESIGK